VRRNKRCTYTAGLFRSLWAVVIATEFLAAVTKLCEGYPPQKICTLSQQDVLGFG